jgi:uncharacterized membrane protein YoaK (UPF0700 family)
MKTSMLSARAYSFRQKSKLAISLSWIAGYANVVILLACGTVVSHATGNTAHIATEAVNRSLSAAMTPAFLVLCFFCGAVASACMTETAGRRGWRSKYLLPAAVEALLLTILAVALAMHHVNEPLAPTTWLFMTGVASLAMGLQNAMVTEISGAVVRTTHLTGVVTDLGLEGVRFVNFLRDRTRGRRWQRAGRVLRISQRHPSAMRLALLASIFGSFLFGSIAGAVAYHFLLAVAMLAPVAFLLFIVVMDRITPVADVREIDQLSDPELKLYGIVKALLPPELGLYRLSHHRADQAHKPPDFHAWSDLWPEHWQVVVLSISKMTYFTTNSVADLRDVVDRMHADGRELVIAGITPKQYRVLERGRLTDVLDVENLCPDLEFAIARGIELVRQRNPSSTPLPSVGRLVTGA